MKQFNSKILLIDDNRDFVLGMEKLFKKLGNEIRSATDGASALKILKSFRPEIILLDIGLPDMNGYEVARRIREEYKHPVKIIALTGYGLEEDKTNAKNAGFDQFLTKPIDLDQIIAILTSKNS